jgi:hypothetical protein
MEKFEDPSLLHVVFFIFVGAYLFVFIYYFGSGVPLDNPLNFWLTPLIFGPFILDALAKALKLRFFVALLEALEMLFMLPYLIVGVGLAAIAIRAFGIPKEMRVRIRWAVTYGYGAVLSAMYWIGVEAEQLRLLVVASGLIGLVCLLIVREKDEDIGEEGLLYSKGRVKVQQ